MVHHTRRTFLKAGGATAIALLASAQLVHGSGSPGARVAIAPAPDQFGYRTMVGRSGQATGPNVDREGVPMLKGGRTSLLVGNQRWLGRGGESVLQRTEGDLIVFHAYDGETGKPALQIFNLSWKDGWPHAALATTGEAK